MSKKSKQQIKKLFKKICFFCGENDYKLLDVHRIVPGSEGGNYDQRNTLVLCALCHRKSHVGVIEIKGKFYCTSGKLIVNYIENDEEFWKEE